MEPGELCKRLCDWARDMGLPSHLSQLQSSDLRSICRGPVCDAWLYVIDSVLPRERASEMRSNALLDSARSDAERASLRTELGSLRLRLKDARSRVEALGREVADGRLRLSDAAERYRATSDGVGELRAKARLLRAYEMRCRERRDAAERQSRELDSRTRRAGTAVPPPADGNGAAAAGKEEEEEQRRRRLAGDLRSAQEQLAAALRRQLDVAAADGPRARAGDEKARARSILEHVAAANRADDIVKGVADLAERATCEVRERIASVDPKQEAAALMYKHDGSYCLDVAERPSLPRHVERILEGYRAAHVGRFVETEQLKREALTLNQQMADVEKRVAARLESLSADGTRKVALCRDLVAIRCEDSGLRAVSARAATVLNGLKADRARADEEAVVLKQKLDRIHAFRSLLEKKQREIYALAKECASCAADLTACANEARDALAQLCGAFAAQMTFASRAGNDLSAAALRELRAFADCRLHALMQLSLQTACGIAAARGGSCTSSRNVVLVLCAGLPRSPENVLQRLHSVCAELRASAILEREFASLDFATVLEPAAHRLQLLCQRVEERSQELCACCLPKLAQCCDECAHALDLCRGQAQLSVKYWLEEPAQDITPWITVLGATYRQWREIAESGSGDVVNHLHDGARRNK